MRKIYILLGLALLSFKNNQAQTFSDNFDSYTANAFLGTSNSAWKTWTNKPGGADDIKISNAKAHSGSNSLYFTSVAANGGPSDIVLPFGSELTSGTFSMSMYMFVDTQKKGYFNLQEQKTLGNGWSIDVNFDSIGGFEIVNTQNGRLLSGTYTQNTWFKCELKINLSSNTWEFLLDDVSKGSFQNYYRKIASMDIYPTFNSSYYIDDISYTITPQTPSTLNASLTYIDKVEGRLSGQKTIPMVEIRNLGSTKITSATVEVSYNGNTISKSATGLNIDTNALAQIPFDNFISLAPGLHAVTATIKQVNGTTDDISTDNTKSISINPTVPAPNKVVVAEEATGTWCTWCPRGAVFMRKMDDKYGDYFVGIAVHNNDPMENANYDGGLGTISSGYPSMVVDRGADIDPSVVEPDFLKRIMVAPKGGITCGANYTAATKELKVSLTTKFLSSATGNYKLAFVLVEDNVTGSGNGWDQVNSYAGGSKGEMGGFEKLPNPVPAAQMVYDHVGRVIYPNFKGLSNAFASTINANDSFIHNFSVNLDPSWKYENLAVVGLLIDPSGKIDNANRVDLAQAIANGYRTGTQVLGVKNVSIGLNQATIYPNPSKNQFTIELTGASLNQAQVEVYSMDGKLMYSQNLNTHLSSIDASAWPAGVYVGTITSSEGLQTIKLVKE
ncbi:MAG: hypothetical protein CFE21_00105 [Bacteroidetes bacterium B1(2017)]|nr:MAG: hypothetical protein CFE21_00105 [Bacteroidetes bacterium B1(2017)]